MVNLSRINGSVAMSGLKYATAVSDWLLLQDNLVLHDFPAERTEKLKLTDITGPPVEGRVFLLH